MRETPRARQAWADYLALGDLRSLEKLVESYQARTGTAPTIQLSRLKAWSRTWGWQARLAALADAQARATSEREEAARAALQAEGIRNRQNRLAALNDRAERMARVILERAEAKEFEKVAGGTTGLLVRTWKIGGGDAYEEFAVDTGLLAELRAHEKQAAQELGQWVEKGEIRGSREAPLVVEHVSPEQVERAERAFLAALGLEPGPVGDHASDDHPPDAGTDTVPPV